jgi:hypothetical protein
MRIRFREKPFTEQLPSDSPGIVDVFTRPYQTTHVPSCCDILTHLLTFWTLAIALFLNKKQDYE